MIGAVIRREWLGDEDETPESQDVNEHEGEDVNSDDFGDDTEGTEESA